MKVTLFNKAPEMLFGKEKMMELGGTYLLWSKYARKPKV